MEGTRRQFVQLRSTSQQCQMDSYCPILKNQVLLSVRRCHMTLGTVRPSVRDLVSPTELGRQFFIKIFRTNLCYVTILPGKVRIGQALRFPARPDSRHMKVVRLSDETPWCSFLLESQSPQGHSAAGRIQPIKCPNDNIRNRTRDFPACSAVPQPTAPQRAHSHI